MTPQNTFGINSSTGYVEGEVKHVAVTLTQGRVVMTPVDAPNTWTDADYAAYEAAQAKKEAAAS